MLNGIYSEPRRGEEKDGNQTVANNRLHLDLNAASSSNSYIVHSTVGHEILFHKPC